MSTAPTPTRREDPDPNHRPLLDNRPFFIETRSSADRRSKEKSGANAPPGNEEVTSKRHRDRGMQAEPGGASHCGFGCPGPLPGINPPGGLVGQQGGAP